MKHSKLYVKPGCPWCRDAMAWLDANEIRYQLIDVLSDKDAYQEMVALSGQTKTPTLQMADGRLLADFGIEELPAFLKKIGDGR